jgi:hypothetical protein
VPGSTSSDFTWKLEILGKRTSALLSGQLGAARELAMMYREYLSQRDSSVPLTEENILDHLREPPRRFKSKLVEQYFRLKWAVSYRDFLDGKLNNLPESELLRISSDVNNIRFPDETCMLIASLATGEPGLFTVFPDGQVFSEENFAVVGSGYPIARAALCQRNYHQFCELSYALYAVYEAKKLSEGDPNVGPQTAMWVDYLDQSGRLIHQSIDGEGLEFLESQFEEFGPRLAYGVGMPPSLESSLASDIVEVDEQKNLPEAAASGGSESPQK